MFRLETIEQTPEPFQKEVRDRFGRWLIDNLLVLIPPEDTGKLKSAIRHYQNTGETVFIEDFLVFYDLEVGEKPIGYTDTIFLAKEKKIVAKFRWGVVDAPEEDPLNDYVLQISATIASGEDIPEGNRGHEDEIIQKRMETLQEMEKGASMNGNNGEHGEDGIVLEG